MKHFLALRGAALALSALIVCASACEEKAPPPTPGGGGGGGRLGSVARGVRDTVRSTEGAINDNQQKAVDAANDVQAGNASQAGKAFGLAGVEFTLQPGWTAVGVTGSMRKADLLYKGSAGEVHAIFYTEKGTAASNLSRWESQVELAGVDQPKTSVQTVNGLEVHMIDVRGTYRGMTPMGTQSDPEPNSRFIGVFIEGGRAPIQIKLVGPERVVNEAAASFNAMLRELRKS